MQNWPIYIFFSLLKYKKLRSFAILAHVSIHYSSSHPMCTHLYISQHVVLYWLTQLLSSFVQTLYLIWLKSTFDFSPLVIVDVIILLQLPLFWMLLLWLSVIININIIIINIIIVWFWCFTRQNSYIQSD